MGFLARGVRPRVVALSRTLTRSQERDHTFDETSDPCQWPHTLLQTPCLCHSESSSRCCVPVTLYTADTRVTQNHCTCAVSNFFLPSSPDNVRILVASPRFRRSLCPNSAPLGQNLPNTCSCSQKSCNTMVQQGNYHWLLPKKVSVVQVFTIGSKIG